MQKIENMGLYPISEYVSNFPPSEEFNAVDDAQYLYLTAHRRIKITIEETPDIGYGLDRCDKLGEMGISDFDIDTKLFAKQFVGLLRDEFSEETVRYILKELE